MTFLLPELLSIPAAGNNQSVLPEVLMLLPLIAGATLLPAKQRKKAIRKAKWQLFKALLKKKTLKLGKGIRVFLVVGLILTAIIGAAILPLWVCMTSIFALLGVFFLTDVKD